VHPVSCEPPPDSDRAAPTLYLVVVVRRHLVDARKLVERIQRQVVLGVAVVGVATRVLVRRVRVRAERLADALRLAAQVLAQRQPLCHCLASLGGSGAGQTW